MKFYLILLFAVSIIGVNMCQDNLTKESIKTTKDKVSYSIGINIGSNLKMNNFDLDVDLLLKGLKDAFLNDTTVKRLMTDDECTQTINAFQQELSAKQQKVQEESAGKNKAEGEKFLAENKKKEGVVTLPSGLQYKVIKSGTGKTPKATDTVLAHYTGTLINGTKFDSSVDRGEPTQFPVNGVIKGWTEALQLMKEGDKWNLFSPSDLAYGPRGVNQLIGPNTTLVFEVELIKVIDGK
jgi:FKBP-type peptidyl-prolyl cis-trans isomerase FklB